MEYCSVLSYFNFKKIAPFFEWQNTPLPKQVPKVSVRLFFFSHTLSFYLSLSLSLSFSTLLSLSLKFIGEFNLGKCRENGIEGRDLQAGISTDKLHSSLYRITINSLFFSLHFAQPDNRKCMGGGNFQPTPHPPLALALIGVQRYFWKAVFKLFGKLVYCRKPVWHFFTKFMADNYNEL